MSILVSPHNEQEEQVTQAFIDQYTTISIRQKKK